MVQTIADQAVEPIEISKVDHKADDVEFSANFN